MFRDPWCHFIISKEVAAKKFLVETLPVYLDTLEKLLKENNSGDGFFVGDNVSTVEVLNRFWMLWHIQLTDNAGVVLSFWRTRSTWELKNIECALRLDLSIT